MEYARFTEGSNSIDYLEKAVSFIKSAENKPEDWKWVILAVQGALYGFMICNLKGTAPDNVSKGKSQDLISFDEALRRCQDPKQQPQKPKTAQDADWRSLGGVQYILGTVGGSKACFASTPLRVSQPICALQARLMVNPTGWNVGNADARL